MNMYGMPRRRDRDKKKRKKTEKEKKGKMMTEGPRID